MEIENLEITGGCQLSTNSPGGSVVTGNLQVQLIPSSFGTYPLPTPEGSNVWVSTQSVDVYGMFYNGNVIIQDPVVQFNYNSDTGFTIPNLSTNTSKFWVYLPSVGSKTSFNSLDQYTIEIWLNISL